MYEATNGGLVVRDDALAALRRMPDDYANLVYVDPPFFANREYVVEWGDEAEVSSFSDNLDDDLVGYTEWVRERVVEVYRVLKSTGSLYFHCDFRSSHVMRIMLDEVFGRAQFQNEIVWYYHRARSAERRWTRSHDTILFYTKSLDWTFNQIASQPNPVGSGRTRPSIAPGLQSAADVWEFGPRGSTLRDRLGYPTQKPEKLLERIVLASSAPGDVVLDPFSGSGTSAVVAERLGRRWVAIEISPTAVGLIVRRLAKESARPPRVEGIPRSDPEVRELRPFEFRNWVVNRLMAVPPIGPWRDVGVDAQTQKDRVPVEIKRQEVGAAAVREFADLISRIGQGRGVLVALDFDPGAAQVANQLRREKGPQIDLIRAVDLVGAVSPDDEFQSPLLPAARDTRQPTLDDLLRSTATTERRG